MTKLWQRLLMQQGVAPAVAAYRYWGLNILDHYGDSYIGFKRIYLRTTPGGATLTNISTPCLASSSYSSRWRPEATVGAAGPPDANEWASASYAKKAFICYDLLSAFAVKEVGWMLPSPVARRPKNFQVVASNESLSGPWTTIITLLDDQPVANGDRVFSIP